MTQTQELTQQRLVMTMTTSPPANYNLPDLKPVTVTRASLPGLSALPTDQHTLDIEGLCANNALCSYHHLQPFSLLTGEEVSSVYSISQTPTQLLAAFAFAALLFQRQPGDVPELHDGHTIQQVVHREFRMLQQQLGYEAVLTPMDWIDVYCRRHTLRQRLLWSPLFQEQHATFAASLAFLASQLASTHIRNVPSSFTLCSLKDAKEC